MKILAINGSPRKDGNTAVLLNRVLNTLKAKGFETELVQLCGEQIRGCRACGICKKLQNKKCVYAQDIFNEIFSKSPFAISSRFLSKIFDKISVNFFLLSS